jgi:hypothetical protein
MKKSVLLKSVLAFIVFLFTVQISMAGVKDPKKLNDLKVIVKKHVVYPEYAKENNLTGFVIVAFEVDNNGKILISQINSNLYFFQEYVVIKLQQLVLKNPENYQDKTQYYRFDFQLLTN